jgi:pimeloyl-ACP methyl ester carboxylesterase
MTSEGLIAVDGAELYWSRVGDGRLIVVLHGGPGVSHDHLARSKFVVLPRCGHFPFVEAPGASRVAVLRFLESLP